MIKNLHYILLTFLLVGSYSFSQSGLGTLKGTVKDEKSKDPLPYSKILIKQNGTTKGNALTDFDGKFQINAIQPGSYNVEVRNSEGYPDMIIEDVRISSDKITFLNKIELKMPMDVTIVPEATVIRYKENIFM